MTTTYTTEQLAAAARPGVVEAARRDAEAIAAQQGWPVNWRPKAGEAYGVIAIIDTAADVNRGPGAQGVTGFGGVNASEARGPQARVRRVVLTVPLWSATDTSGRARLAGVGDTVEIPARALGLDVAAEAPAVRTAIVQSLRRDAGAIIAEVSL